MTRTSPRLFSVLAKHSLDGYVGGGAHDAAVLGLCSTSTWEKLIKSGARVIVTDHPQWLLLVE